MIRNSMKQHVKKHVKQGQKCAHGRIPPNVTESVHGMKLWHAQNQVLYRKPYDIEYDDGTTQKYRLGPYSIYDPDLL